MHLGCIACLLRRHNRANPLTEEPDVVIWALFAAHAGLRGSEVSLVRDMGKKGIYWHVTQLTRCYLDLLDYKELVEPKQGSSTVRDLHVMESWL